MLGFAQRRALLLVRALTAFYLALGAFVIGSLHQGPAAGR
jgi:hypothetical protein